MSDFLLKIGLLRGIGAFTIRSVEQLGQMTLFLLDMLAWIFRPPLRIGAIIKEMEFVGVNSIFVVILTGGFTGGVFTLQSYYGFRLFGAESMVGPTVALAMTRELGPVLTALMVTGRAGSAMAAELGAMRVTEQIDALHVMAANPVKYLVVPRVLSAVIMLPLLTAVANFLGIIGGWVVGVKILGIPHGLYEPRILEFLSTSDIINGMIKAAVFGGIFSFVGCFKGFNAAGGAEGVGKATTEAVVLGSVLILIVDYFLTALMF